MSNPSYPPSEAFMEQTGWQTPEITLESKTRSGWTRLSVNADAESIAQAVRDYGGVIIVVCGSNNQTWLTPYPKPPKQGEELWYHFLYVKSAEIFGGLKQITAINSWGEIGEGGRQHFTDEYLQSGYISNCFTLVRSADLKEQLGWNLQALFVLAQKLAGLFKS